MWIQRLTTLALLLLAILPTAWAIEVNEQIAALIEKKHYLHPETESMIGLSVVELNHFLATLDPYSKLLLAENYARGARAREKNTKGLGLHTLRGDGYFLALPYVTGPSFSANFLDPRFLLMVDGKPISRLAQEAFFHEKWTLGETVPVILAKDFIGPTESLTAVFDYYRRPSVEWIRLGKWNLMRIFEIRSHETAALIQALFELPESETNNIVLDLRFSPGGSLEEALEIASLFLAYDTPMGTLEDSNKVLNTFHAAGEEYLPNQKIPILISRYTASSAEILALILKESNRALLIGEPSRGKCMTQQLIKLKNGATLKITTSQFFSPNHHNCDNMGLQPDYTFDELETLDSKVLLGWLNQLQGHKQYFICEEADFADRKATQARIATIHLALQKTELKYAIWQDESGDNWYACLGPTVTEAETEKLKQYISDALNNNFFIIENPLIQ